nr:hypothetical protein [Melioribacteraceae bacterium]
MIKNIWLIVLIYSGLFAQTGFFVKFKANVENNVIENINNKIITDVLFESGNLNNKSISVKYKPLNSYYFSKGNPIGKIFFVDFNDNQLNSSAIESFSSISDIEYIEENKKYSLDYLPNDTDINKQWAL